MHDVSNERREGSEILSCAGVFLGLMFVLESMIYIVGFLPTFVRVVF